MNAFTTICLWIKRVCDIIAILVVLPIALPVCLAVALYIKRHSPGKAIFTQARAGYHGKPFTCYKFRTMSNECGADGELLSDELRLQRWGKRLRDTSLDELPQLWNVLKGEMSLVGPRPLPVKYLERYTQEQMHRHDMRPGMTGWTSVNGRNNLEWPVKLSMDVWYVTHWSLWLDLSIVLKTIGKVIRKDGTHKSGHATRDEFTGMSGEAASPQEGSHV